MFPMLYRKNPRTGVCKNGSIVSVIRLQGSDYTGMSKEQYDLSFNVRKKIFEKEKDFVRLDTVSRKTRVNVNTQFAETNDLIQSLMIKSWKKNFDVLYRTYHYIVITVHDGGLLAKVGKLVSNDYKVDADEELEIITNELMMELKDYSPHVLEDDELTSFFATMLNGKDTFASGKLWDQYLANTSLDFNPHLDYCQYGRNRDKRLSSWLTISNYPDKASQRTLDNVFCLPLEFNLYQSFQCYSQKQAANAFALRAKELMNWGTDNEDLAKELMELSDRVEAGKISFISHCFALEIFGNNEIELDKNVNLIRTALEKNGALFYRETTNIEALFWSRFPTMSAYNLRTRDITSENAAHFSTFNSIGEGFDTCGFGARPVTMFKTIEGGQYSFTFHQSPELKPDVLGHTGVIGGTGTGKTTLIAFLLANCLPYENFKTILFDRLQGLKIFTEMFDGDYLDFGEDVRMNPFLMNDTTSNRMFLASWLKRICRIDELDTQFDKKIEDAVRINYSLDKSERSFEELAVVFGREGDELQERLRPWLSGGHFGNFFNSERDSFNFEKQIVTFDATLILDIPEVLPVVTDYIFHKIMMQVSEEVTPHVLFFDEAPRYFREKVFADRMLEGLKEIRKKAGVAILAMQDPQTLISLPDDKGYEVINALANYIIYPNRGATKAHYMDFLGLNDKEFEWVKESDPFGRKVLFKRRDSGSSVILDIDMSGLNTESYNLFKCFDSSVSSVNKLTKMQKEYPNNWRLRFLKH